MHRCCELPGAYIITTPSSNVCTAFTAACAAYRAGELSAEELEQLMTIVANPQQYKIPNWFLNRCEHSNPVVNPTFAHSSYVTVVTPGRSARQACSSNRQQQQQMRP